MNKEMLIKIFRIFSGIFVSLIVMGCFITYLTLDTPEIRGVILGIGIGVTIGGIIKIKYSIPRKYRDKDERTMLMSLISSVASGSYFGVASFICFVLMASKIIEIDANEISYFITICVIVIGTIIVDKLSYFLLQKHY